MVSLILVIAIIIILAAVVIASYKRAIFRKNQELSEYEHYIKESKTHYAELTHEYNEIKRNLKIPNEHSQTLFVILENRIKSLQNYWNWHLFVKRIQIIFTDNSRNISRSLPGKSRIGE